MKRKYLSWAAAIAGMLALVFALVVVNTNDNEAPSGVVVGGPTLTQVTTTPKATVVVPPSTVTVTKTAPPVETIKTITVQPPPPPEDCSATLDGWNNSGPKGTGEAYAPETDEVVSVRIGQHDCFDQVTIDIDTTVAVGSHFEYTSDPRSAGSGDSPEPAVAGGAVLQGKVFAWAKNLQASGAPYQYSPAFFDGWKALREVRFDVSYESETSFFIGTVSDNAFQMRSWQDGPIRKIIIRVAH